jgi:hypothetical protein
MSRLIVFSIVAGVIAAWVAWQRGRNWAFWGCISFFFPFMLLVVLILPPVLAMGTTKKCPHCAEIIKQEATVCKYCGRELPIEMVQCKSCGKYVPDGQYCIECNRALR